MTVAIPDSASTVALSANTTSLKAHAVWFQNFSTATGFNLEPLGTASTATSFYLPPATSATLPASLIIQSSGGDTTLPNASWRAFQASGGSVNLNCGRW